jgi:phosphatidylserine/phosphatidylglycerophosphate/cardiolipin synthase-like enzyme
MSRINGRAAVMRRLAELNRAGCNVQIAFAEIGPHDHAILADAGIGLHRVCLAVPSDLHTVTDYLHSKYLLVAGNDRELGPNRRIVYTGSDNLGKTALSHTDDRLERYVEAAGTSPIFDAYLANFRQLMALSHFGHQSTATCSGDD